jgi:glycogen synthase
MNSLRLVYTIADSRIRMIYNGVDTEFWNKKNVSESDVHQRKHTHGRNDRYVVLYYGHAGKSKGLDYLVQAMPEVIHHNKDILFAYNLIDSKRTDEIIWRIKKKEARIKKQYD